MSNPISISAIVSAPIEKVWEFWSQPKHITQWAFATETWDAPLAENDLRVGGTFRTTMAAKDKSGQFDFEGTYTAVEKLHLIAFYMSDGRQVNIEFTPVADGVEIVQTFDPETENDIEMQRSGWQAILDNFKKYCEAQNAKILEQSS